MAIAVVFIFFSHSGQPRRKYFDCWFLFQTGAGIERTEASLSSWSFGITVLVQTGVILPVTIPKMVRWYHPVFEYSGGFHVNKSASVS